MATRTDVLTVAASQLGVTEDPPGSNRVRYWPEVGQPIGSTNGWAWCAAFATWVLLRVGVDLRKLVSWPYQCQRIMLWAKAAGRWKTSNPTPGDLVLYCWDGSGHASHIGIHERSVDGLYQAIEGNTSPTNVGSQSNGGGVYRRVRSRSVILGWVDMTGLLDTATPPAHTPPPVVTDTPPAYPGRVTRRGSVGPRVRTIQRRLKARGWTIKVDGVYGPATEAIVRAFQREKHLGVDGVVGPRIWVVLWIIFII
jgi:hypothetical protein